MLSAFVNSFKIQELRQRILFTLGVVFLCRLLSDIPIAGVAPLEQGVHENKSAVVADINVEF